MVHCSRNNLSVIFLFFIVQSVVWGLFSTFSMYYQLLVNDFNSSYAYMGLVGTGVAAIANFVGTVPGWLIIRLSYPMVFVLCGITMSLAYLVTSFDTMSWELFFTYSILFGFSGGIMSQVAFSLLLDCIEDDINFIVALLTGTIGVGYMVFSCLSAYVLFNTDASWQVLFRYYSLGGVVIASLSLIVICIDTNHKKNITHEEEELSLLALPDRLLSSSNDDGDTSMYAKVHGWNLLYRSRKVQKLFVSNFLGFATMNLPAKFSIVFMSSSTNSSFIYYVVPVCIGTTLVVSRIVFAFMLLDKENVNPFKLNKYLQLCCGVVCVVIAFIPNTYVWLQLTLLCLHEAVAAAFSLLPLRTVELLGKTNHHMNIGVQFFSAGVGILAGAYCGGLIYDSTGSFTWLFLYIALFYFLALVWDEIVFPNASFFRYLKRNLCGSGDYESL